MAMGACTRPNPEGPLLCSSTPARGDCIPTANYSRGPLRDSGQPADCPLACDKAHPGNFEAVDFLNQSKDFFSACQA